MDSYLKMAENNSDQDQTSHYQLVFQQSENPPYCIWRHHLLKRNCPELLAMLVDLNNAYVSDLEIERIVCDFLVPVAGITSIAFANCHSHNRQEIKRKLKASSVKLYSKTGFFTSIEQAKKWLEAQ
ncbi:hypothetical protein LJC60_10810 [Ruminococcaceae bacterium OttesenSCG-928-D13]|nr:hypothetical protein [Ruminococcaceae bacterium OttesenSCG-928-D13]